MKKVFLALSAITSISSSSADVNSCNFDFPDEFNKISNSVKTTAQLIGKSNFYKNLDEIIIYQNGREKVNNKNKFKFSNGDYFFYDKNEKDLCIIKKIDYNYKKFVENGYLDYLKEISDKYSINYHSLLAIFKEETGFNSALSGGFGRMTNTAIDEVNRFFKLNKGKASDIRKSLKNNQKLAIKYSVLYFYIMKKRNSGNEYSAVRNYNGNKKIASNGKKVCDNYVKRFKKNYKLVMNF